MKGFSSIHGFQHILMTNKISLVISTFLFPLFKFPRFIKMGSDLLQSCDYREVPGVSDEQGESHDSVEEQTYSKERRSVFGINRRL